MCVCDDDDDKRGMSEQVQEREVILTCLGQVHWRGPFLSSNKCQPQTHRNLKKNSCHVLSQLTACRFHLILSMTKYIYPKLI